MNALLLLSFNKTGKPELFVRKFFILITTCIAASFSIEYPLARRSTTFDDFRPDIKIIGHSFRLINGIEKIICAKVCHITPECLSFNFYLCKTCELNSKDLFSNGTLFEHDPGSVYTGMLKDQSPICYEEWRKRDITNEQG